MRAFIYVGGDIRIDAIEEFPTEEDLVIAADSGYANALALGVAPTVVLGDFDSLGYKPDNAVSYKCVKDFTDGEGAVEQVKDFATEIEFYNFGGGREDHFYGNLSLLIKAEGLGIKARAITNTCEIYYVTNCISLDNVKNKTVTIAPFGDEAHILKGEGLAYSVDNIKLSCDKTLGVSNIATEERLELKLKSGKIFVFVVKETV